MPEEEVLTDGKVIIILYCTIESRGFEFRLTVPIRLQNHLKNREREVGDS